MERESYQKKKVPPCPVGIVALQLLVNTLNFYIHTNMNSDLSISPFRANLFYEPPNLIKDIQVKPFGMKRFFHLLKTLLNEYPPSLPIFKHICKRIAEIYNHTCKSLPSSNMAEDPEYWVATVLMACNKNVQTYERLLEYV